MNYELSAEQRQMRDHVRQVCRSEIAPNAEAVDETHAFPWKMYDILKTKKVLGIPFPSVYDGTSGDKLAVALAMEEIARVSASTSLIFSNHSLGSLPLLLVGTREQKERYLPALAHGDRLPAYALTEPEAGSDARAMRTTARQDGDSYVINGAKTFITGGDVADIVVVFARMESAPDLSAAFLVERATPGFNVGKTERKLGVRGSSTAQLFFEDVRVPAGNLLGREGGGFRLAMTVLDYSRPTIAAQAVGIAEGALDVARAHASKMPENGRPRSEYDASVACIGELRAQVDAARATTYAAVDAVARATPTMTSDAAIAKLVASDTAMHVTTEVVELLGAHGLLRNRTAERLMRDAKITQIYEGTNEIQRIVIARSCVKRVER